MGSPWGTPWIYKDFTPSWGSQIYKHQSFRRKSFSPWLISNGGKRERMPWPCAMGLGLDAFKKFSNLKGEFRRTASSTSRHSFHVRWMVRKPILNEPKRYGFELFMVSVSSFVGFGYFWASKVMKRIGIPELLRRFDYFCAPKVMKRIGIPELLRRFDYFCAPKVTKNLKFVFFLKLMTLPARGCILECSFDSYRNRRAAQKKRSHLFRELLMTYFNNIL
ncbi:hypothetical protein [Sphingobacterium sp.]|uniref:hypothetical protein n=1 Tax=Sphingobacterium sp. TaxID=341027 RepID=UPI0028ADDA2E|nr:hypothetical protein [Sphingobacterium sp.]